MLNGALANDLEVELLSGVNSKKIQELVVNQVEGTIAFLVRLGRHEKTTPPVMNLMNNVQSPTMNVETYKAMVDTVINTVKVHEKYIERGYITVDYKLDEGGFLGKLKLYFGDVVSHKL